MKALKNNFHLQQDQHSKSQPRKLSRLEPRLAGYAAAGVAMMAAGTSGAQIQYTALNAPMSTLTPGGEAFISFGGQNAFLGMMTSLNRISGDASVTFSGFTPGVDAVTVAASAGGQATSTLDFLPKGTEVGGTGNQYVFATGGYNSTNIVKAGNHEILYTGLRTVSGGKNYYGWAAFSFNTTTEPTTNLVDFNNKILGYAFETSPNTPIAVGDTGAAAAGVAQTPAPEPSTLALLAMGAVGIVAWRAKMNRRAGAA
jgi:hypothetical protein